MKKKPIEAQTIVITGASSGIGLATARLAAEKGARVVLASRNKNELQKICKNINNKGESSTYIKADVSKEEDIRQVANHAIKTYGGFDSWINNAGVGLFGPLMDVPIEDERRLFDVNYWSVVYGSQTALEHLREEGGTIINMGSSLSMRALPLQGTYSATKHAVKAFSDSLRLEVEKEEIPVNVITLKPGSVNTPFANHARNRLDSEVRQPPPYYEPEVVARSILKCCVTYQRNVAVANMAGSAVELMEHVMPGTLDKIMEWKAFDLQKKNGDRKHDEDILYDYPENEGQIRGEYEGHIFKSNISADVLFATLAAGVSTLAWLGVSRSNDQ